MNQQHLARNCEGAQPAAGPLPAPIPTPPGRDRLDLLPLRQAVHASGDAARVFARPDLLARLSRPERFRLVGHGSGGQILAASEAALGEAQALLRQACGALVQFGTPAVHTYVDARTRRVMAPLLFMRIDAPRRHLHALLRALEARAAQVQEVEVQRGRAVLRVELGFGRALGLADELQQLTEGAAHILSWLLRYQAVQDAP